MKRWYSMHLTVFLFAVFFMNALQGQSITPTPKYVPPNISTYGEQAHYKDLAIIETSCSSIEDAKTLWSALIENGALISVITSPQRMLAWVPPDAYNAVMTTQIQSVQGKNFGVVSISRSAEEFRARPQSNQNQILSSETSEADEAIVSYLEFVRRPLTDSELQRIKDRELELRFLESTMPQQDCEKKLVVSNEDEQLLRNSNQFMGGSGPEIKRATKIEGWIVNSSFFVESGFGTGSFNWDGVVYDRYRNLYLAAMNYWTSFASKYGKSQSFWWRLYSPYSSTTQVHGEPAFIGEDVFIPEIIPRLTSSPPAATGWNAGNRYVWVYNNDVRSWYGAAEAICGFIAYKSSGSESIWPHAWSLTYGNGDREGTYFALDTQYWQAGHDPFAAPMRNVIAHETGHLWGAPDEYVGDPGCFNWVYRGIGNINCQQNQPARGRPGLTMTGFEGIMKGNYISGNSIATPVHDGIRAAGSASPIRCFITDPANIPITVKTCDDPTGRTWSTTMCIPMDFDFCQKTWVPLTRTISGTVYYFDHWEIRKQDNSTQSFTSYANELPSSAFYSTLANPVVDVKAFFTSSPPDIYGVNNTVSAWLSPSDNSANPGRAIVVKWQNKLDMQKTETWVEYEFSSGNWVRVAESNIRIGRPFGVMINQWTGVQILTTPNPTTGLSDPLIANKLYRFRIVSYFNTLRGTPSQVAEIRTRPATPPDSAYCYDTFEPNSLGTPKSLTSSGPGMHPDTVNAACPISGWSGEFTWFTPKNDYYRITVIGLSGTYLTGEHLAVELTIKPGSNFKPRLRAQRVGTSTYTNAVVEAGTGGKVYILNLLSDGEYIISIEPQISTYVSNDLVDRTQGHLGFGEYLLTLSRDVASPWTGGYALCPACIRLDIPHPYAGLLIPIPHPDPPPLRLFREGFEMNLSFQFFFSPDPGFEFDKFDGDFGPNQNNPMDLNIDPAMAPRTFEFTPFVRKIAQDQTELVLIYPDGPGGALERRTKQPFGTVVNATANPPSDFIFIGWVGDTASTTNPLPVTMWKNKRLIAYWRPKPCQPEAMSQWAHKINFVNGQGKSVQLDYGEQATATDAIDLALGEVDLPPSPPVGVWDVRWINITGSQGSIKDVRPIRPDFVFTATAQSGTGGAPVQITWPAPSPSPNVQYIMRVSGDPVPINMRTRFSYLLDKEGRYQITVEVKEGCPDATQPPGTRTEIVGIKTADFPCMELALRVRNSATGEPLPFFNPFLLNIFEKNNSGAPTPMNITHISQDDSTIFFRICSDGSNPNPNREIQVGNNNDPDPNKKPDTTGVTVPVTPNGCANLVRTLQQRAVSWELVSLPLDVLSPAVASIFSDPGTTLYSFAPSTGTYVGQSTMTFGTGYWLRTNDKYTVYYGCEKNTFLFSGLNGVGQPFGYGWNLIGSVSHPVLVSSIVQNPAGGLVSIFGWNPGLGYVVPTKIDSGKGYWVRVNPGTTLKMTYTGFTGDGQTDHLTQYEKVANLLNIAGQLIFNTSNNESQSLFLTPNQIRSDEVDVLQLPALPPSGLFDIRTSTGMKYAGTGENYINIQAQGDVTITYHPTLQQSSSCEISTEKGELIAVLDNQHANSLTLPVNGLMKLKLNVKMAQYPMLNAFDLGQNYPNPFSASSSDGTYIPYSLDQSTNTRLVIYDMLGRVVRMLLSSEQNEGSKLIQWDGRNENSEAVPPGMYIYRLESNGRILSKSLSIVK